MVKIALRQAWRNPFQSLLLVLGISLGTAACLLLASYISGQFNYDQFQQNKDRIVRIQTDHLLDGMVTSRNALTYAGVPVLAKERLSQVEDFVRLGHWIANDVVFRRNGQLFRGRDCLFVDPSFFSVFNFELLQGDPALALIAPGSLVLTESVAALLFGEEDPMGKPVQFEHKTFQVTGVAADPPESSHIQFDMLGSLSTMHNWQLSVYGDEEFESTYVYGYLLLQDDTDLSILAKDLNNEIEKVRDGSQSRSSFSLQPFSSIYLTSQLDNEMGSTGEGASLFLLAIMAIVIMLLAWVNHINIFSAISIDQVPSRSIQRIVGASRKHLFAQLFLSAAVYVCLGVLGGVLLFCILIPTVKEGIGAPLVGISNLLDQPYIVGFLSAGNLAVCVAPALVGSTVSAKHILVGQKMHIGGRQVRKILVASQLGLILVLLIGSGCIHRQLKFMQHHDLGLDVEHVLVMKAPLGTHFEDMQESMIPFQHSVESIGGVEKFSVSHHIPGDQLELISNVRLDGQEVSVNLYRNNGSSAYFDVYKIPFLARAEGMSSPAADGAQLVIDQSVSEQLGFSKPEEALGHEIDFWGNDPIPIVGVVHNYKQRSLHHEVLPIVYDVSKDGLMTDGYYSVRLNPAARSSKVASAFKSIYEEAFPNSVFDVFAAETYFSDQYIADRRFEVLNFSLTMVGVVIACMGILGLIMIVVRRRMKEISIRKTLGATTESIFVFLSADFVRLLCWALLVAVPTAYYISQRWLQNFAFQVDGLVWPYVWGILALFVITLATISINCLRAARTNPADILREGT